MLLTLEVKINLESYADSEYNIDVFRASIWN